MTRKKLNHLYSNVSVRAAFWLLLMLLTSVSTSWAQTEITGIVATDGTASEKSSESFEKLFDNSYGSSGTKWCVTNFSGCFIEFQSRTAFVPTQYRMCTANDCEKYNGRNPKNWVLKAKAHKGDAWTTIATVNNAVMADVNNQWHDFSLSTNNTAYKYFRFEVSAVQSGTVFQLAEFKLLGNNVSTLKQFIKDVKLIGGTQNEVNTLKNQYIQQGWTVIDYDLNKDAGGNFIYLLCKYDYSYGSNFAYISNLYLRKGNTPPDNLTHDNRTFYLAPYEGGSSFTSSKGNLNNGCSGGDEIHLYYTKSSSSVVNFLSDVYVNTVQSGALGQNGGTTGYSLNAGVSNSTAIYLHTITAEAITYTVNIASGAGSSEPPTRYDSDNSSYIAASKEAAQNLQFYNDNGRIGFKLEYDYTAGISPMNDSYQFYGWDFAGTGSGPYHLLGGNSITFTAGWLGWQNDGNTITGVQCSDFLIPSITSVTVPQTIGGTAIKGFSASLSNLTSLQSVNMSDVVNVSGTPFAGCSNLTSVTFTKANATYSFADGSFAGLTNRINVNCYSSKPQNFNYKIYEQSPNLMFIFTNGFCGWCGDTGTANGLHWILENNVLTIDCCDDRWRTNLDAQIIQTHTWSDGYASFVHQVNLAHVRGIGAETFMNNANLTDLYYDGGDNDWNSRVTKGTNWKKGVAADFKEHFHCSVHFNTNGHGTYLDYCNVNWSNEDKAVPPYNFFVEGYDLIGWYTDADCTTAWDFDSDIVPGDMTLYAGWADPISDTSTNDLTSWNGKNRNISLYGRDIYLDDSWNTICLPFSLSSLTGTLFGGLTVKELDTDAGTYDHKTGFEDGTLYLNFKDATSIVAGRPYLVKGKATTTNISYTVTKYDEHISSVPNMFDGNTNNYASFADRYKPWYCEFNTSSPVWITGYRVTDVPMSSAGSYIWTLKGKLNENDPWITIDHRDRSNNSYYDYYSIDTEGYKDYTVHPSRQGLFKYFRLDLEVAGSRGSMEIAEFELHFSDRITNPSFTDVVINSAEPTAVTSDDEKVGFVGSYSPVPLAANDRSVLYLGDENTLYWPAVNMTIGSCRAIFQLNGITAGQLSNAIMCFDGGETTGVSLTTDNRPLGLPLATEGTQERTIDGWYTLDGRKLNGKPTAKGIYLNNGRRVLIK